MEQAKSQTPFYVNDSDLQEVTYFIKVLGFTQREVEEYQQAVLDFDRFNIKNMHEESLLFTIQNDSRLPYKKNEEASRAIVALWKRNAPIEKKYRQIIEHFEQEMFLRQQRLLDSGITPQLIISNSKYPNPLPRKTKQQLSEEAQRNAQEDELMNYELWGGIVITSAVLFLYCLIGLHLLSFIVKIKLFSRFISLRIITILERKIYRYQIALGLVVLYIFLSTTVPWSLPWDYTVFLFSHDVARLKAAEDGLNLTGVNTVLVTSKFPNTKVWLGNRLLGSAPLGLPWSYLSWIGTSDTAPPPVPVKTFAINLNPNRNAFDPINIELNSSSQLIFGISVDNLDPDSFALSQQYSSGNKIMTVGLLDIRKGGSIQDRIDVIPIKPQSRPIPIAHDTDAH